MLKTTSRHLKSLDVTRPTVVVDEARARANIAAMAEKARRAGTFFRPHFKTHQNADVGRWFATEGIERITVSSVRMAEYFVRHRWRDLTVAFPLNPLELPAVAELATELAGRGGRLGVTIASAAAARALADHADLPVRVWLEVDTGYGRSGIAWNDAWGLLDTATHLGDSLPLAGLLTHAGHSYRLRDRVQLRALYAETRERLAQARESLAAARKEGLLISVGDTPTCNVVEDFSGVDEVRPGNFIFNDLMQLAIDSCAESDLALAVACPVVGVYPDSGRIVIHGGAVHLSKESLQPDGAPPCFGVLGTLDFPAGSGRGRGDRPPHLDRVLHEVPLASLTQEHGVFEPGKRVFDRLAGDVEIGDLVLVWPVHSCLVCDLHADFLTLDGRRLAR